ncbi:hypothetical protein I317_07482 [Kwoniella heveanensis CBS 569]|uniref:Kelch repeat protein n=1 Tax=Kwoniella heveanensis BCC8398 TaxID=1296120 RepID=A0A1B9GKR2_9TREE|nr:hypothetical protein I316_06655 [Kwoniella heveanensis BCC8398]OCF38725.1 hypothetical protein I317_07482 [Kwoniella heveanensis CBS 569]
MSSNRTINLTKVDASLPRSSHSISVVNGNAYIYGGEINPREPVDGDIHRIELSSGRYERIAGSGDVPEPRVGHVAGVIEGKIYVFGGRGGPAMTPLDEQGAIHVFDPSTSQWTKLSPTPRSTPNPSSYPCARSYHCSTVTPDGRLIIHAGCGDASTGRLKDTWSFDPSTSEWSQLPDAPGDPRGGSSLAVGSDGRIWRFGGFNGKTEVGGSIEYLKGGVADCRVGETPKWESIIFGKSTSGLGRNGPNSATALLSSTTGPGARSVTGLHVIDELVVVMGGEGKPSSTGGHDAAGNFWDDVWAFDSSDQRWDQLDLKVEGSKEGVMEPRGWFASDVVSESSIIVWGGINSKNERLSDGWILRV